MCFEERLPPSVLGGAESETLESMGVVSTEVPDIAGSSPGSVTPRANLTVSFSLSSEAVEASAAAPSSLVEVDRCIGTMIAFKTEIGSS